MIVFQTFTIYSANTPHTYSHILIAIVDDVIVFHCCTIYLADTPSTQSHFLILLSKLFSLSCVWSQKNKEKEEEKVN